MSQLSIKNSVPEADILNAACPSRTVLRHVTDRWAPMIITSLATNDFEAQRFTTLRKNVGGISGKVLTETLRSMERDGLVSRTTTLSIPPRVEYQLTALGKSVVEPIGALRTWAQTHVQEVEQNRKEYDQRLASENA